MTVSKSVEKRLKAVGEEAKEEKSYAIALVSDGKLTAEKLTQSVINAIVELTAQSKKKSIYQITEEVVDKINKGVEAYEKKRIKEKMKARAKA